MTPQPHAEIWNRNSTEVLTRKDQAQFHQIHGFNSILVANASFSTHTYFQTHTTLLLPLDAMFQM